MSPDDERHGTNAGYRAHFTHGVIPCGSCREAHAEYRRQLWRRKYVRGVDSMFVPSLGTVRRIRALQAIGWRLADIDLAAGRASVICGRPNFVHNITRSETIRRVTAEAVERAYVRLHLTPGPSERSRAIAQRNGWHPPAAWDDIDNDPEPPASEPVAVDPVVVDRILAGDYKLPATPAERLEVVARWPGSLNELARVTGWNVWRDRRVA